MTLERILKLYLFAESIVTCPPGYATPYLSHFFLPLRNVQIPIIFFSKFIIFISLNLFHLNRTETAIW